MPSVGSIEQLKSLVSSKGGFAKSNLYYVYMPSLAGLGNADCADGKEDLGILCKSVSLPSRQLATVPRPLGPDFENIVYGYQNSNITLTFRVLNDQGVREYFESWQRSILGDDLFDRDGHYSIAFPDEYQTPIQIFQLERGRSFPVFNRNKSVDVGPINVNLDLDIDVINGGGANYMWDIQNAYPLTYQSETLSDDAKDQISEVSIEFAFKKWKGSKQNPDGPLKLSGSASIDASQVATKAVNKLYKILN